MYIVVWSEKESALGCWKKGLKVENSGQNRLRSPYFKGFLAFGVKGRI